MKKSKITIESNVALISISSKSENKSAKEQRQMLRDCEKLDKETLLKENCKISVQFDNLKKYILNGYMSNTLSFYGYSTKNKKRDLLNSITVKMLFSVAPYKANENGTILGQLIKRKLTLREETDQQTELYTNIYIRKEKHSLANVIDLFIKVLRKKHESISFKSESIDMNLERFTMSLKEISDITISEYQNGTIQPIETK